ncbi:MAG: hypothetical protein MAG453_01128 [Calditrichaeota bacterium]|nr:hypothetical protein [Calditrichota bacterium]
MPAGIRRITAAHTRQETCPCDSPPERSEGGMSQGS